MKGYSQRYVIDKAQKLLLKITMPHIHFTFFFFFFQLVAASFILGDPNVNAGFFMTTLAESTETFRNQETKVRKPK